MTAERRLHATLQLNRPAIGLLCFGILFNQAEQVATIDRRDRIEWVEFFGFLIITECQWRR